MKDIKPFQLVFLAVCLVLGIGGMLIFSFAGGKPNKGEITYAKVIIWGTLDEKPINDAIDSMNPVNQVVLNAEYIQKDEATFSQDLLEALVEGNGPDVILIPISEILSYKSRITPIPFKNVTERSFKDSFIQEAELYRFSDGYLALPFAVDPLVMYWNRDIFTAQNISTPPSTWDQVLALVPTLSDVSTNLEVNKSAIALGEYRNVRNAKEIISTLMLQTGNGITFIDAANTSDIVPDRLDSDLEGADESLSFYTQFADPQSPSYSWNRSLGNSQDIFASNDLAMYIGYGSEVNEIITKNPNLNFDMTLLPQPASNSQPVTYGKMYGLSILNSSINKTGALDVISLMTGQAVLTQYAALSGFPPVRRDLLVDIPSDSYSALLYKSALYSSAWLDPNTLATSRAFQTMVDSVLSQGSNHAEAVEILNNQLSLLIESFNNQQRDN